MRSKGDLACRSHTLGKVQGPLEDTEIGLDLRFGGTHKTCLRLADERAQVDALQGPIAKRKLGCPA